MWVNEHGELVAETELGPVKFTKPMAYQEIDGKRVDVECGYVISDCGIHESSDEGWVRRRSPNKTGLNGLNPLKGLDGFDLLNPTFPCQLLTFTSQLPTSNSQPAYGFKVASYDRTKDLIIDPLLASTYLGGTHNETGYSITLDTSGNVYVTGYTKSTDFPTTDGAYDTYGYSGPSYDVFVSKLDSGLTSLLASTYLGGALNDYGLSLALDTSGNVYVMGYTEGGFPTTDDAFDTDFNGYDYYDVFVSKLDSGLTNLLASTYLGGFDSDYGYSLALGTSGNVYVTGYTESSDFPTTGGAYDTSFNGGDNDVFVSKLDSGLTSLLSSTYLGGFDSDYGYSLALGTSGNVYVTGYTESSDFPTTGGAYDTSFNGGDNDVFVSKLDSGLTSLLSSTYLGGFDSDYGYSLALGTSGNVYVTGYTESSDFPTTGGAYDASFNGGYKDVFVSKLGSGLTILLASTYFGGSSYDNGYSLTLDSSGHVYVTGSTYSTDFPTTSGAYDTSYNGGDYDVFVSKLNGGLTNLLASTYLGGGSGYALGNDSGSSLALDTSGNVYVTGDTSSSDFPTTGGAYDTSYNTGYFGYYDAFVSNLDGNLSDGTAQPHINNLSSYFGTSGAAVTMNGVNFGSTQGVVNFGAITASVTSWNDTSIAITVPGLPPETYSISVTTNSQTSNALSFLLTKAPSGSDFSIDAKPSKQTVVRGSFALYSVFIKSINGFNKPVTLRVKGLPKSASASFQRNPVFPGEWVDLTITTTGKTPVKIHSFTVKGSASGLSHVKSAKLQVKPAKTVVDLKRSYSPELTVLLIAENKKQTGDKIIANVSLMNTTGTWVKATLNQEEQHSASINKFEDYVILLGPYATKSLGPITFQKGEHLRYDGDRVSFEPLTVLAIDLFLRGALGQEVPPNAFMDVFSYYDYGNTLLGDVLRKLLDEEFGCSSLAIDFGKDLKEGNAIGVLNDLAELLQCTGAIKQEMHKLFMQVLKNKKLAKKAANFLDDGVETILGLLQIPDHYVEFKILMCPSLVPPIDGYFESLGLCNTLGSPLEGFVRLEAVAEEQSNE